MPEGILKDVWSQAEGGGRRALQSRRHTQSLALQGKRRCLWAVRSVRGRAPLGGGRRPTSAEPREMGAQGRDQTGEGLSATEEQELGLGRCASQEVK